MSLQSLSCCAGTHEKSRIRRLVLPSHLIRHFFCPPMRITKRFVLLFRRKVGSKVGSMQVLTRKNEKILGRRQAKMSVRST